MEINGSVLQDENKVVYEGAKETKKENTAPSSPARRARLLKKSRDRWKRKIKEDKKRIKALQIKTRDLDLSRETWKERAKQAEVKLKEAMDKLLQLGTEGTPETQKKTEKRILA